MHTGEYGSAISCILRVLITLPKYETAGFENKFNKTYFDLAKGLETACLSIVNITSSKANNLKPTLSFMLLKSLAISYHIQKRFDEAKGLYLQCLNNCDEPHYDSGQFLNLLASLEEQVGNPGGALNWIDLDKYPLIFDPPETISGMRVADFNHGLYEEVLNSKNMSVGLKTSLKIGLLLRI
jgi:tetratricopeptide (TPR) repeat protein